MRDDLPKRGARSIECGIVNLDNSANPGTHWIAYIKRAKEAIYFDSFGNLQPPKEIVKYLSSNVGGSVVIKYNHQAFQTYDSENCGHLCLLFLYKNLCE